MCEAHKSTDSGTSNLGRMSLALACGLLGQGQQLSSSSWAFMTDSRLNAASRRLSQHTASGRFPVKMQGSDSQALGRKLPGGWRHVTAGHLAHVWALGCLSRWESKSVFSVWGKWGSFRYFNGPTLSQGEQH